MIIGKHEVRGKVMDSFTRCEHYHSELDIVAIKFACCNTYYPCYRCHLETAGHTAEAWPKADSNKKAILCGSCHNEMSIEAYKKADSCPFCHADFNPGCENHYHYYFG
ncbi:CHY zinc finger protein [Virgibacillus senegalensis]|uniref:CHY zinc finger protein n=1 Tax=Virgibacillus senegalensis TaxID=1499679 RepID=UPI00069E59D4|nr:CHY zinc finger protein [Virgibacillus senegalensis]